MKVAFIGECHEVHTAKTKGNREVGMHHFINQLSWLILGYIFVSYASITVGITVNEEMYIKDMTCFNRATSQFGHLEKN